MQRRSVMMVVLTTALVLSGAVGVRATSEPQALNQYGASALNRQNLGIISIPGTTSSQNWRAVPGWGFSDGPVIRARSALAATLSVTVSGGPAAFKVLLEVGRNFAIRQMNPPVVFNPGTGTESFSYTFVATLPPSGETVNLYWRSPTGTSVTLRRGTVVLQYDRVP